MYTLPEGRRRKSHIPPHLSTPQPATPSTPISRSATQTPPSLSARPAFDWDAARANRPIYATPTRSSGKSNAGSASVPKSRPRVYRRESFWEKAVNIFDPTSLWDTLLSLPSHIPLPESRVLGFAVGALLNLCHWCVWWATFTEDDSGWELETSPKAGRVWFWTGAGLILLGLSCLHMYLTFSMTRAYQMFYAREPLSSAHASFVAVDAALEGVPEPSVTARTWESAWRLLKAVWNFLVGAERIPSPDQLLSAKTVQQLDVWNPGDGQLALLITYSPVHALLFQVSPNSLVIFTILPALTAFLLAVVSMYIALVRDRQIIAAEVLHEYNEKFVYPTTTPVKKDAETMTHEAEIIDFRWR